jgi:hypothetical protein
LGGSPPLREELVRYEILLFFIFLTISLFAFMLLIEPVRAVDRRRLPDYLGSFALALAGLTFSPPKSEGFDPLL